MSNLVQFPERECVMVIEGTAVDDGLPIYLLELVTSHGRVVAGDYRTRLELACAVAEWQQDGVEVRI